MGINGIINYYSQLHEKFGIDMTSKSGFSKNIRFEL